MTKEIADKTAEVTVGELDHLCTSGTTELQAAEHTIGVVVGWYFQRTGLVLDCDSICSQTTNLCRELMKIRETSP